VRVARVEGRHRREQHDLFHTGGFGGFDERSGGRLVGVQEDLRDVGEDRRGVGRVASDGTRYGGGFAAGDADVVAGVGEAGGDGAGDLAAAAADENRHGVTPKMY
jgi:hypothetical protein